MSDKQTFDAWWKSVRLTLTRYTDRGIARQAWVASAREKQATIERLRARLIACKTHADCINHQVVDGLRDGKGA